MHDWAKMPVTQGGDIANVVIRWLGDMLLPEDFPTVDVYIVCYSGKPSIELLPWTAAVCGTTFFLA